MRELTFPSGEKYLQDSSEIKLEDNYFFPRNLKEVQMEKKMKVMPFLGNPKTCIRFPAIHTRNSQLIPQIKLLTSIDSR